MKINLLIFFFFFLFFAAPVYEEQTALEVYDDGEFMCDIKIVFPKGGVKSYLCYFFSFWYLEKNKFKKLLVNLFF